MNLSLGKLNKIRQSPEIKLNLDNSKRLEKIKSTINKSENINLIDVNNLIDEIEKNVTESDNIVDLGDNKEIYFRDLLNFLHDIKENKIRNFNKEK